MLELVVCLCLAEAEPPVDAGTTPPPSEVSLSVHHEAEGGYGIEGTFWVPVAPHQAWDVIKDYEHIPQFVTSIARTQDRGWQGDAQMIELEAKVPIPIFQPRVRVLMAVRHKGETLRFVDVLKEDFLKYEGDWTVKEANDGSRVTYRLNATPSWFAPKMLVNYFEQTMSEQLLQAVRDEIIRRATEHSKSS